MNEDFFEAICRATIDAPFEKLLSGEIKKRKKERDKHEKECFKEVVEGNTEVLNVVKTVQRMVLVLLKNIEEDAFIITEKSYELLEGAKKYVIGETGSKESKREFNALTGLAKAEIVKGIEKMFEDLKYSIDEIIGSEEDE